MNNIPARKSLATPQVTDEALKRLAQKLQASKTPAAWYKNQGAIEAYIRVTYERV